MSADKQKEIFSKNLNSYISNSGKTQAEIAKNIGVSPQTFNTWCKGIAIQGDYYGKICLPRNFHTGRRW